jgi:tryptophan-specific transport protein
VVAQGGNVDVLLKALASVIESEAVSSALNLFSMAAILSSFIGVGLGVFDYLANLFKFDNGRGGRFRAPGGLPMIVGVLLFGVLTALFHLLNMAGLLPVYTG